MKTLILSANAGQGHNSCARAIGEIFEAHGEICEIEDTFGLVSRWLSSAIYLFMGWLAIFAIVPIYRLMPPEGFFWLLLGGILYTIGGVLYAVKWPGRNNPRFGCHEIFHLFILLGSAAHFVMMQRVILHL